MIKKDLNFFPPIIQIIKGNKFLLRVTIREKTIQTIERIERKGIFQLVIMARFCKKSKIWLSITHIL